MATNSPTRPSSAVENPPPSPAAESVQAANEISKDGGEEVVSKQSPASVFINSEPMREEQVQNAVKFLSHPRVRGSPVMYRRSFLERKGLTKEEIDEAFRRVPDPPPGTQATPTTQDGQVKTAPNGQQQAPQPVTAIVPASKTSLWSRFQWYEVIVAIGLLSTSSIGTAVLIKNTIIPRVKSWIRKIVFEGGEESLKKSRITPSLAEETAAAAKSAAAAAADVAKASIEIVNAKYEEERRFRELMNLLHDQVKELKSLSASIHNGNSSLERSSTANSQPTYVNGTTNFETRSGRSLSPPVSTQPSVAPHSNSYMEIMEMVQRGERPPNIREINDQPPNPDQPISNSRVQPIAKPWEVPQAQNGSTSNGYDLNYKVQDNVTTSRLEGENTVPWWQQKNPRIREIENEYESGSQTRTVELPVRRAWVPPQPPPVMMPEAAEAIRRPKPQVQKDQSGDDQILKQSTDLTDELQKVTKISESGRIEEINGGESTPNTCEIQEA